MQERDSQEGFQSVEEFTGKLQAFMHTASLRRNNMNMKRVDITHKGGNLGHHCLWLHLKMLLVQWLITVSKNIDPLKSIIPFEYTF